MSQPLWMVVALTVTFAALARLVRGVNSSGAVAGGVVCFLLFAGAGRGAFIALLVVFALTWIATRFGYQRKQAFGTAERREGRKASQVLANLGLAAACAGLYWFNPTWNILLLALSAALSEAAADTVSSELGQASSRTARLITSWKEVPAGTDGGVSVAGTISGAVAAAAVSLACVLGDVIPLSWMGASALAAMLGMIVDSYLGASLERRRILNNDLVNLAGTAAAASVAMLLA